MSKTYFTEDYLEFFKELAKNNHKEWFDLNRKRYEKSVKAPFQSFISDLILMLKKEDLEIEVEPKDAIFRINKDIRFSKDKTPYKLSCSAIVSPGGKKNKEVPGIYIEAGPEDFRIYGGVYMLSPSNLNDLRFHIAANSEEFNKLISDPKFKKQYGEIQGDKNKRIPTDLVEAGEKQPLIYNKSFYFFVKLPAETILSSQLLSTVLDYYQTGKPLGLFIRKAIHY
ncbi:MAG: DUF2461 domain-containing protein [Flavobacteriales bacterium]|nr:DUF2461 domain-containing protein [Flavobacteriales bacterium]